MPLTGGISDASPADEVGSDSLQCDPCKQWAAEEKLGFGKGVNKSKN